jgi:hypothetical protein
MDTSRLPRPIDRRFQPTPDVMADGLAIEPTLPGDLGYCEPCRCRSRIIAIPSSLTTVVPLPPIGGHPRIAAAGLTEQAPQAQQTRPPGENPNGASGEHHSGINRSLVRTAEYREGAVAQRGSVSRQDAAPSQFEDQLFHVGADLPRRGAS